MNDDERAIVDYLKTQPKDFVTVKEICRRAVDINKFRREPDWAKRILIRMAKQDILETNAYGQYRLKPDEAKVKRKKIALSPQIQKILEASGKVFVLDEDIADSPPAGNVSGSQDKPESHK
jgi:hypothetical protein